MVAGRLVAAHFRGLPEEMHNSKALQRRTFLIHAYRRPGFLRSSDVVSDTCDVENDAVSDIDHLA